MQHSQTGRAKAGRAKVIGLVVLILLTLGVRIGIQFVGWGSFQRDEDSYGRLAINWARTGYYTLSDPLFIDLPTVDHDGLADRKLVPTAYRPPMYPWMLSSAVIGGRLNHYVVAGMHVALGLATVLSVYVICRRLHMRWPTVPALAVACDPILLRGSQLLMTETLVTFLAVSSWLLCLMLIRPQLHEVGSRRWGLRMSVRLAALLGTMLGLAVLTRPTMLPWALVTMFGLIVRRSESSNRGTLISTSLLLFMLVLAPWIYRNEKVFDKPIVTTTHGGYTLLLANNPILYRHFRTEGPGRDWPEQSFHDHWAMRQTGDPTQSAFWEQPLPQKIAVPDINELQDDQLAQQAALATIKRDPAMFAWSCLCRVGWLWSVFPQGEASVKQQWIIGSWYTAWFGLAVIGLLRLGKTCGSRVWLIPLMLVLSLTAIHAVYWSNMRMRAPLMPVVYVIACWPVFKSFRAPS